MKDKIFSNFYLAKEKKNLFLDSPSKAFIQFSTYRYNLISGENESTDVSSFLDQLKDFKMKDTFDLPTVFHLFYELGEVVKNEKDLPKGPLAIFIEYKEYKLEKLKNDPSSFKLSLKLIQKLNKVEYTKRFRLVNKHLLEGDCYQVNLTSRFRLEHNLNESRIEELIPSLWKDSKGIGAYAHGTYIEHLKTFYLSNSPECLFQILNRQGELFLRTMPIKGTVNYNEKSDDLNEKWKALVSSKKDEGELNMITDLLRNDLTQVELKPTEILTKKWPLKVPGILHQMSILEVPLSKNASLKEIVESLFPGGSITGAPKKRVMQIIKSLESEKRGFYCGSTVLLFKNLKTASINIRSCELNLKSAEASYGAGGGVTLLSNANDEYEESLQKLESFLLFTK